MKCVSSARAGQVRSSWSLALLFSLSLAVAAGCSSRPKDVARLSAEIAGLKGSGLVLSVNSADVAVTGAGTVELAALPGGMAYTVAVKAQPVNPPQVCTVANGTGTVGAGAPVRVTCVDTRGFTGQVRGLAGTGLAVTLTVSGSPETVQIDPGSATTVVFSARGVDGSTYEARISAAPTGPAQLCSLENGSGTIGGADVELRIVCSTQGFKVGGTATNVRGSGLALQLNGGDKLQVAAGAARFEFPALADQASYSVTVASQPSSPAQTCAVTGGQGKIAGADVTSVAVTCLDRLTAQVTGLKGNGLVLTANAVDVPVASPGPVDLGALAGGAIYRVSVKTQPTNPPQVCSVTNGTGVMGEGAGPEVVCGDTHGFAGQVQGLAGTGLTLTLSVARAQETIRIDPASPAFTFAVRGVEGDTYVVQIDAAPTAPVQVCSVENGSGKIGPQDVALRVTCSTQGYKVGGTVTNLRGTGLTLQINGGATLQVPANATQFQFPAALPDQSSYKVTLTGQPSSPTQTCTISGDQGKLAGANATSVAVSCTTSTFAIVGSVAGPVASGLVLALYPGGPTAAVARDAQAFAFSGVESGTQYDIQVATAPSVPSQQCTVTGGRGTMADAGVTNVSVACHAVWRQVSAGASRSYAIAQDGTLWGWGDNSNGSLGDGTATQRTVPVQIGKGRTWRSVSAGAAHTLAIADDGTLWGWGSGWEGRLGDALADSFVTTPQQIATGVSGTWASASAGSDHSLAILVSADGTRAVWGWGKDWYGQVGDGGTYPAIQATPKQVLADAVIVSAGDRYSVAIARTDALIAWGVNWSGRFGSGDQPSSSGTPLQVATGWASVCAGSEHTVGLKSDGTLWAWGKNANGQVGDGTATGYRNTPYQVLPPSDPSVTQWRSASAGSYHSVAIRQDRTLWAWGGNDNGQMGNGTTTKAPSPTPIGPAGKKWDAVSAGNAHTLAIADDGRLWAWGYNYEGQLGIGSAGSTSVPSFTAVW